MKQLKGILFDLDGVFYIEKTLISGGNKTLAFLRQEQIPFRFVTNNTTLSRSALTHKLQTLGLEVEEDQILSANYAGILQVKKSGFDRCRLLLRLEAQADYPPNIPERPDAIVIGDIGDAWNYDLLNDLMRQVLDGAEIVALHKGRYHEGRNGLQLDSGAFVAALEHATGKKAVVVGKPSKAFFTLASEVFSCSPEELIMIGDDDEGMDFEEVARVKKNLPKSALWVLPNVAHGAHEGETKDEFILKSKAFLSNK